MDPRSRDSKIEGATSYILQMIDVDCLPLNPPSRQMHFLQFSLLKTSLECRRIFKKGMFIAKSIYYLSYFVIKREARNVDFLSKCIRKLVLKIELFDVKIMFFEL